MHVQLCFRLTILRNECAENGSRWKASLHSNYYNKRNCIPPACSWKVGLIVTIHRSIVTISVQFFSVAPKILMPMSSIRYYSTSDIGYIFTQLWKKLKRRYVFFPSRDKDFAFFFVLSNKAVP